MTDVYGQHLFPSTAWRQAFTVIPHNVKHVQIEHLQQAQVRNGEQWMLIAGWECQDLSPTGAGRGLQGSKSSTFRNLVDILNMMQELSTHTLPIYLMENTTMQYPINAQRGRVEADFQTICHVLGPCVEFDAVRVGSSQKN